MHISYLHPCHSQNFLFLFFIKLGWALFVTYTIIQSIMRSEMCSLHLTHPSVHTWSSGQPTVQRPGSSRGLPVGAGIRTHNLGLPRVSSPTLYPLGQRLSNDFPLSIRQTRFAFGGEAYQYRVLPFSLALSPHTFKKCVDAALAPLRLQGIRILNYIDDWLILAQSEQMTVQHWDVVFAHMKVLGLRLNGKKSGHVCPLFGSIRSSRESGECKKASHSLSSSFRDCWVWW